MKLPLRLNKQSYEWCLNYKQMGRHCKIKRTYRDWTKEEQMSYLDWDLAENKRAEYEVTAQMAEDIASGKQSR